MTEFDISTGRFVSHLREHAGDFFPELATGPAEVRTVAHIKRHYSQLLQLEVTSQGRSRQVIYKIPFCPARAESGRTMSDERPRLYPEAEPTTNGLREFTALKSVEQHFRQLQDERFKVIPILALLNSPYVVVMEKSADQDLKSLMKQATRFHRPARSERISPVLRNAGAWLREFHSVTPPDHVEFRHATRGDFIDSVRQIADGLSAESGRRAFIHDLVRQLQTLAEDKLPEQIPRAVIHGDFAPRNILVSAEQQVTVFDTQRRWYAPFYEDLAYFLTALKASGTQVRFQGLVFSRRQIRQWETAFFNGYFQDETPPLAVVRLYECLLLLDRWAAVCFRQSRKPSKYRPAAAFSDRFFSRCIVRLTKELQHLC